MTQEYWAEREKITFKCKYLVTWSHIFVVCQDEFFPKKTTAGTCMSGCSNKLNSLIDLSHLNISASCQILQDE